MMASYLIAHVFLHSTAASSISFFSYSDQQQRRNSTAKAKKYKKKRGHECRPLCLCCVLDRLQPWHSGTCGSLVVVFAIVVPPTFAATDRTDFGAGKQLEIAETNLSGQTEQPQEKKKKPKPTSNQSQSQSNSVQAVVINPDVTVKISTGHGIRFRKEAEPYGKRGCN